MNRRSVIAECCPEPFGSNSLATTQGNDGCGPLFVSQTRGYRRIAPSEARRITTTPYFSFDCCPPSKADKWYFSSRWEKLPFCAQTITGPVAGNFRSRNCGEDGSTSIPITRGLPAAIA